MTDTEKSETLAIHVMGWRCRPLESLRKEKKKNGYIWVIPSDDEACDIIDGNNWNPLTDENHFYQCLIEVMKDERLITRYIFLITKKEFNWEKQDLIMTMKLSLPERVDKLIEALNSLPSEQ